MANTLELINMSNDTHNNFKGTLPAYLSYNWEVYDSKQLGKDELIGVQIYKNESKKEVVLAIQGTNDNLIEGAIKILINEPTDWENNIPFATGKYTQDIKDLVTYANENLKKEFENNGYKIQVTGFSQGGGLSELLSYTYGWGGSGQFAPGAKKIVENDEYKNHLQELGIQPKGVPSDFVVLAEKGDMVDDLGIHLAKVVSQNAINRSINSTVLTLMNPTIGSIYYELEQHDIAKLNDYVMGLNDELKNIFNSIMELGTNQENRQSSDEVKSNISEDYKSIDNETAKRLWEHILKTDDASLNNVKTFLDNEQNNNNLQEDKVNINDEVLQESNQNLNVYRQRQ